MRTALFACPLVLLAACSTTRHVSQTPSTAPATTAMQDVEPVYKVIALRYAPATDLARTVRAALVTSAGRKSAQVVPDDRTNSVIVTCAPSDLAGIEKLIAQLDVEVKKP